MEKAWLDRPKPHYIYRMKEFLDKDIIAIGWPELGPRIGKTKEDIKTELILNFPSHTPDQINAAASTVFKFVNEICTNDIVIVPDGDNIYFFRVVGDYYYDSTKSGQTEGYPHQRKVELITGPVRRNSLPETLQKSLRIPRGFANLSHIIDTILNCIGATTNFQKTAPQVDNDYAVFDYPVRLNKTATIKIPKDITQAEAIRLSDFIKTLHFE